MGLDSPKDPTPLKSQLCPCQGSLDPTVQQDGGSIDGGLSNNEDLSNESTREIIDVLFVEMRGRGGWGSSFSCSFEVK